MAIYTSTHTGAQIDAAVDNALTSAHRNMLDNWDFYNAIDQRRAHYLPSGVTYYSNSTATTSAGTTENYHALTPSTATSAGVTSIYSFVGDGTDGTSGTLYYAKAAQAVTGYYSEAFDLSIDRWLVNNAGLIVAPSSSGLVLNNVVSANVDFFQVFPAYMLSELTGKTATFSAQVGGTVYTLTASNISSSMSVVASANLGGWQMRVGLISDKLYAAIRVFAGYTVTVQRVKMEMGEISTLANDPPCNAAEELAKCQRYLAILTGANGNNAAYPGALGFALTTTSADIQFPLATTLYVGSRTPTLSDTTASNFALRIASNATAHTATAVTLQYINGAGVITLRCTTTGLSSNFACTLRYLSPAPLYVRCDP